MHEKGSNALVITQILNTCVSGTSVVRIIFASRMNFNTIKPYLASLAESGFIETVNGTSYRTTEKGLEALEHPTVLLDLSGNMETGMDRLQLQD
jgi:predicted transcriptional regulator